jgi:ABC-type transport system involved in cytochrome c biogenesis permease component
VSTWRIARLIAAKDLRIELRSRVVTNQVLPFAALVMVMCLSLSPLCITLSVLQPVL